MKSLLVAVALATVLSSCSDRQPNTAPQESPAAKVEPVKPAEKPIVRNGPFGVEMGMTAAQIRELIGQNPVDDSDGIAIYSTAPRPFPGLEQYSFWTEPKNGLCKVSGYVTVTSNSFGHQVSAKVEELVSALTEKYGPPSTSFDKAMPGTIWNDPQDFMMGLLKKERGLAYLWASEKTKIPSGLRSISVEATGVSREEAIVRITYDFANITDCIEEEKGRSKDAL